MSPDNPPRSDRHDETAQTRDPGAAQGNENVDRTPYRLLSIDAVRAPEGCTGNDWHIYRIAQGKNGITGYRRGDVAGVRADVETIVTALNGRRQWTKSKALSTQERRAAAAARRGAAR